MQAAVALLAFLFVFFPSNTLAKTASDVFEQASPSVVIVEAIDSKGKPLAFGSGVVIAAGEVVTNAHVIKGADALKVRHGGRHYPAKIHFTDWDRDLCQLTVAELSAPAAGTGSTKGLKTGGRVYAIGAPQGLELTLSEGIISSLRPIEGGQYIQITAPISKGSSGGGLFDDSGRLIGITSFYVSEGQNLNFAVPVEWVGELPKRTQAKPAPSGGTSLDWINKALYLESGNDWTLLLGHTQAWVKAEPWNSVAWYCLGVAYGKLNQPAKEIEAYQQAIRIDPDDAAWFDLGIAYGNLNQPAKAIEANQQALRINPDYYIAWHNLGYLIAKQNQPAKAIEAFQQAIRINPDRIEAWYGLSLICGEQSQWAKAIEANQQVIRINPDHDIAWHNLGVAYNQQSQPAKAIAAFQQAIRINPDYAKVWVKLGIVYYSLNQPAKAIEAFQQAIRINPDDAEAWSKLGVVYAITGNKAKVMDVYRTLKTLDPEAAERFFNAAVLP